jgi:ATP-dependent DNA helicase RecQ
VAEKKTPTRGKSARSSSTTGAKPRRATRKREAAGAAGEAEEVPAEAPEAEVAAAVETEPAAPKRRRRAPAAVDAAEEPAEDGELAPGSGLDPGALAGVTAELEAAGAGLWDDDGADADDPLDFVLDAEPVDPKDPIQVAAARIGIERLHPEQRRVIDSVLAGRDVLMVLPTGFGKSACYQIPSMVLPKPVLVISPLLALMRDQYEKLLKRDVPVVRLDGTVRGRNRKAALERIAKGGSLLVMTTPETLATEDAVDSLGKSGVSLAAIDEAHCISEWGYDFRPAYLQIGERLRRLGAPPVLALTATATEKVRTAIQRFVGMRDPEIVASSPHRSNLAFDVLRCSGDQRLRALMRLVLRLRRPGIIYCSTTREVDEIYALLHRFGAPAHRYHGKMNASERTKQQDGFMRRGRRTVMVATNAFGLGIDKQDIRYVLHYQSPASLEQYVQEAGRAGRDGRRSNCILLFSREDRLIHEALLSRSRVRPEQLYKLARALAGWAGEGKVPSVEALALSADLGPKIAGALLAVLEEATLVKWDTTAVYVTVPAEEIETEARKLAGQFATLRTQDSRRLDSMTAYAEAGGCRAVFLREYFGEEGSEPCGMCDTCRGSSERPSMFFEPLEAPRNAPRRPQRRPGGPARPERGAREGDRGRRRGRGRHGQGHGPGRGPQEAPRPGAPAPAARFGRPAPFEPRSAPAAVPDDGQGPRRRGRRGRRRGKPRDLGGAAALPSAGPATAERSPRAQPQRPQQGYSARPGPHAASPPPYPAFASGDGRNAEGPPGLGRRRRRRRGRGRRGRGPTGPDGTNAPRGDDSPGPTT